MRVLVACEFSGIVRDAFAKRGHDAWSCDILPTERPGNHLQDDVLNHLADGWDLMIAHPPCTYFANSGLHYLKTKPERQGQLDKAFEFLLALWNAPINSIAVENPTGWLNTHWTKPTQIIQPYYFGEPEIKTTCLWLKNLSKLTYVIEDNLFAKATAIERPKPRAYCIRKTGSKAGRVYNYYYHEGKNAHNRSRTFQSVATAMAAQWG